MKENILDIVCFSNIGEVKCSVRTVRYGSTYQAWIDKSEFLSAEEHIVHGLHTCKIEKDKKEEKRSECE